MMGTMHSGPLTATDRAILDIERQTWIRPGPKVQAIIDAGWSETRYYQRLNQLLDDPAALAAEPVLIYRLRRLRASRLRSRRARVTPA